MVSLFGGGRTIKNKKLKREVEKIDKDIKKLLKEAKKDPLGWHLKKAEEFMKLIEKILKEIEEHKKSLHELYGFRPNDFPELEMLEHNLRECYKILEGATKSHTLVNPYGRLEANCQAIQTNWHLHKNKILI
jgi:DNA-binding transcriptional regulator GbsR (MarR family)